MNPFDYEIGLKAKGPGRPRKGALPWLYNWQYGRELYSEDDYYKMVNSYKGWIYVAAGKNAVSCASVPLRLYVAKNNKGQKLKGYEARTVEKNVEKQIKESPTLQGLPAVKKAVEFQEILEHPFLDSMRNINGFMNQFDFKETIQLFLELTGNAYIYVLENKIGIPKEFWIIPTQNIKIVPDKQKFIKGYKYIKGSEEIDLAERQVIHFKMSNPRSQYYGFPPFSSIAEEFGLFKSINIYEEAMFRNFGAISGVWETDENLGDHEFERLKQELQQSFGGAINSGKQPLVDNGLKYKPLNVTPKEMSHLKGREVIREMILNAYNQPLGLYSQEANRNNAEAAISTYMRFGIKPRLLRNEEKLNEKLIGNYDSRLFVMYDECIPSNRDQDLNESVKRIQTSITSVDEERIKIGLDPKGGVFSDPFIPVNYTNQQGLLASIVNGSSEGNIVSSPKQLNQLLEI